MKRWKTVHNRKRRKMIKFRMNSRIFRNDIFKETMTDKKWAIEDLPTIFEKVRLGNYNRIHETSDGSSEIRFLKIAMSSRSDDSS